MKYVRSSHGIRFGRDARSDSVHGGMSTYVILLDHELVRLGKSWPIEPEEATNESIFGSIEQFIEVHSPTYPKLELSLLFFFVFLVSECFSDQAQRMSPILLLSFLSSVPSASI